MAVSWDNARVNILSTVTDGHAYELKVDIIAWSCLLRSNMNKTILKEMWPISSMYCTDEIGSLRKRNWVKLPLVEENKFGK